MKDLSGSEGFTMVELLAAMVVSSIILVLVYSVYMFGSRLMVHWERRSELSSLVNGCEQRIASDISGSVGLYECNDSLLVLERDPVDTVCYTFADDDVARNGVSFSTGAERVKAEVGFTENVSPLSGHAVRVWHVRVIGRDAGLRDSAVVEFLTRVSSQEIVSRQLNEGSRL